MPVSRDMLLSELRDLLRLTAFEQAVATVRRAQAASTPIAQELAANAQKSGERLALLGQAVRQVGGVPDVVTPLVGKVSAFVQAQVNQVQTLQGALLGDLALEHSLRERSRYARTLAVSLGESSVIPVLDRLDTAHTETIAWLEERLAEVGATGTSALRATPVQAVVGGVRRLYGAPFAAAAKGVNRLGGLLTRAATQAPDALSTAVDTVGQAASTAADQATALAGDVKDEVVDLTDRAGEQAADAAQTVGAAAQDAAGAVSQGVQEAADTVSEGASEAAGTVADGAKQAAGGVSEGAKQAAATVSDAAQEAADATAQAADAAGSAAEQAAETTHEVLESTGGDLGDEVKHPFAGYERLTGDSIIRHVADTEDVDELRTLLAFEQANKARKGVLAAAQERLTELATGA